MYPASIEADVPPDILRRHFTKVDGSYRVSKTVRDVCVFARQDLAKDPPFSHLDLILCRNVLIYMDVVLQQRLISVFHYALNPTGSPRARPGGNRRLAGRAVQPDGQEVPDLSQEDRGTRALGTQCGLHTGGDFQEAAAARCSDRGQSHPERSRRIIFERYAPPGVVVDSDMQILQFRGQTGPYLEPAPGEASLNLLKMSREGLLHGLRTALHAARKSKGPVRKLGLRVKSARSWKPVNLEIVPLTSAGRPHYLVLFLEPDGQSGHTEDTASQEPAASPSPRVIDAASSSRNSLCSSASSPQAANTSSQSFKSSRRPTRSCSPRTKRSSRATRSSRARTRSWTRPRRSSSRATKSSTP